MAAILIAEDDTVLAGQMARTLRQAGHVSILTDDVHAALGEARERPDVIVLDLELPNLSVDMLLARLERHAGSQAIPVLVFTENREAALQLKADGRVAHILRKPVSGVHLRDAVNTLLATQARPDTETQRAERQRLAQIIVHLITYSSDALAFQICGRICADRMRTSSLQDGAPPTWIEIAEWGRREGLVDAEQANLLCRMPARATSETRGGGA